MKNIPHEQQFDVVMLTPDNAGEVLTLQRAAYASEAQIYVIRSYPL